MPSNDPVLKFLGTKGQVISSIEALDDCCINVIASPGLFRRDTDDT
jgi:hypothetical protein